MPLVTSAASSSEPRSDCEARPSSPSRSPLRAASESPSGGGGLLVPVVIVIAGTPRDDEGGLLVEAEREGEVEELREGARVRRRHAGLGADGGVGSGDERRARDPRRVAAELDARGRPPADADEVHDGGEAVGVRRGLGEVGCPQASERARVGRDEDERMGERGAPQVACKLEERARAGSVVDGAGRGAEVVAVGQHGDCPLRLDALVAGSRRHGDEVDQLFAAAPGDVGGEDLSLDRELVLAQLILDPVGRPLGAERAGRAVGEGARELPRELHGRRLVEERAQARLRERIGPAHAEGGHEEGHCDHQPGSPVDPRRDGPLQGPAPRPTAWRFSGH